MAKAKKSKAKAHSPAMKTTEKTAKPSSDEYWKTLLAMGAENGHKSDRSRGGGIAIVGIGPEPPSRQRYINAFKQDLEVMTERVKDGDCYVVFEFFKKKVSKSHDTGRFIAVWFRANEFYLDLPKMTLPAPESKTLVSNKPDFYFGRLRKATKDRRGAREHNSMFRDYEYGQEEIAAADMAFLAFDLWKLPVDVLKVDVNAYHG